MKKILALTLLSSGNKKELSENLKI